MPIKRLNIPIRLNDLFKVIRFFNSREEELHVSYRDLKDQLQTDLNVTAGSSTLDGLSDVTISSVANGQVLVYDSATSQWINQTAGPATTLNGLTDVTITSVAGGQFLVYNSGTSQWENTTVTVPTTLNSLTDVTTPSPSNGNVLTWDSATSQWIALAPVYSSTFAGLSDVNVAGVADENTIKYDALSGKWVPTNITPATSLNGLTDVTIGTLSNGQILVYNSTSGQWENQSTTPGGVASVTATAPITSSGGSTPNISTLMNTNKLIGRGTAGTGVMEEITLGTGLSLSGTTLNASASGGGLKSGTASGTNNYTVTITGVTSYVDGDAYVIKFTNGNDADSDININSLGVKNLVKQFNVTVTGGDIVSGQELIIIYDGTNFQCLGIAPNQLFAYVTNDDTVAITKGMPVYAAGATGNRMTVKRADNTSDSTSAQTVGLVFSTSIAANQKGFIITQGVLSGVNTGAYSAGQQLYLGATAGALTASKPSAPNHLVYIGIVERANAGNGQIYVKPQNGYELSELHDVQATAPTNNDTLYYDNVTTPLKPQWKTASVNTLLNTSVKTGSCAVIFDGQGGVISNGKIAYAQVPYNGTLTSWTLVAAQSGSCTITVFKDTYANYPPVTTADDIYSVQPALASAIRNQNLTPTYVGSQATVTAGDWIGFTISGVTTVTWVNLSISITKT